MWLAQDRLLFTEAETFTGLCAHALDDVHLKSLRPSPGPQPRSQSHTEAEVTQMSKDQTELHTRVRCDFTRPRVIAP